MKNLAVLCLFLALIPIASAVCFVPGENAEIRETAVFCPGIYNIENGIKIVNDGVIVDCNNSVLNGNGIGYGILVKERQNVIVKNCNVSNYEIGIYLDSTNKSILAGNHLSKNKYGIALFNAFGNDAGGNILAGNADDKIAFLPAQAGDGKGQAEMQKEGASSPHQVMEEVIRIKKPFLKENEVLDEVNYIFSKYFDLAQENLEIKRDVFYNESDKSTRIILHLMPRKALLNVSVYEKIPKCVSAYVNEILIETSGYEVVRNDPLIMWTFPRLEGNSEISYKVFRKIDGECRNLLLAFGIAAGLEGFAEEKSQSINYMLVISFAMAAAIVLYYINRNSGRA